MNFIFTLNRVCGPWVLTGFRRVIQYFGGEAKLNLGRGRQGPTGNDGRQQSAEKQDAGNYRFGFRGIAKAG
jgi:hypothetical protein